MKNYRYLELIGEIDEELIKEVTEYKHNERRKIVMNKKKLFAIALAAAMMLALSVTTYARVVHYSESRLVEINTHPHVPAKGYVEITYSDDGYAHSSLDNFKNVAIGAGLAVKITDGDNLFHFNKGDTVKVQINLDLESEGVESKSGSYLDFGKISKTAEDGKKSIAFWRPEDDVNGVLECTFTVGATEDIEFYVQSWSLALIHVKSMTIEKIS